MLRPRDVTWCVEAGPWQACAGSVGMTLYRVPMSSDWAGRQAGWAV